MTSFVETRLLDLVSYGTVGGPTYNTRETRLLNGRTRRNQQWSLPKYRYTVLYERLRLSDHVQVINAFHACGGSAVGFRLKDWADYQGTYQLTASATGSPQSVQLRKIYTFGSLTRERIIRKPVAGSVVLTATTPPTGVSVDTATGIVTFTGTAGQAVSASFEFDVPVRFESDELQFSFENFDALTANIGLIEDTDA
jgi:uncharacterized protein (TIGR02217 family)